MRRVDAPLTKETRAFPRKIHTRFPVRGSLVDISISLQRQSLPITPHLQFSSPLSPYSAAPRSSCRFYDNFPRRAFLFQFCNATSSSWRVFLLPAIIWLNIYLLGDRSLDSSYFPIPSSRGTMRNNATAEERCSNRSFEFYRNFEYYRRFDNWYSKLRYIS